MGSWVRPKAAFLIGAQASAGVLLAHWLSYAIVAPQSHHRERLLEATGHVTPPFLVALCLGIVVGVGAFLAIARGADRKIPSARDGYFAHLIRLSLLQVSAFVALELVERALVHSDSMLVTEPAVILGIALQVVSAFVGSWVVVALRRALSALVRVLRPRPPRAARVVRPRVPSRLVPTTFAVAAGGGTLRGPPA
jgi:hypothetical protein